MAGASCVPGVTCRSGVPRLARLAASGNRVAVSPRGGFWVDVPLVLF